ncbi:MAG TPA: DMT family transporter [Stellaceae bacterium]|jgi:uncharacterized membrane protein|nr:DMT family transporter [Stellaceae bacterium]
MSWWLVFAFSGPVLWGVSFHLDKYLVERYFRDRDTATLVVFTALIGLLLLPVVYCWQPDVLRVSPLAMLVIGSSGILTIGAMILYLRALQETDVSVIAPLFQAAPLFAATLGYLVLHEVLNRGQLAGGGLIVLGALALSWRRGRKSLTTHAALMMTGCTLSLAIATVVFKFFAIAEDFWTTVFWTYTGEAIFGFVLLCRPIVRRQFLDILRRYRSALLTVSGMNELVNLGGSLGTRYALLFAPIGIIQAIGSTTSLFVFAFGVFLAFIDPRYREPLSTPDLAQKLVGTMLITGGVVFVNQ